MIYINSGGRLTEATGYTSHVGAITLSGGTLSGPPSDTTGYGTWNLDGPINVTANSTINAVQMNITSAAATITVSTAARSTCPARSLRTARELAWC